MQETSCRTCNSNPSKKTSGYKLPGHNLHTSHIQAKTTLVMTSICLCRSLNPGRLSSHQQKLFNVYIKYIIYVKKMRGISLIQSCSSSWPPSPPCLGFFSLFLLFCPWPSGLHSAPYDWFNCVCKLYGTINVKTFRRPAVTSVEFYFPAITGIYLSLYLTHRKIFLSSHHKW